MADYDPSIPGANDILSQSQSDIQNNFSELNTIFDVDHQTWNSDPSGNRGFHKQITMPAGLGAAPTPISTQGILYPFADSQDASNNTQLFFKNGTTSCQVTNRFSKAATTGYLMLPGRNSDAPIIIMWGNVPGGSFTDSVTTSFYDLDFPIINSYNYSGGQTQGFPNNLYNIQVSVRFNDSDTKQVHVKNSGNTPDKKRCTIKVNALGGDFNSVDWFAIGN